MTVMSTNKYITCNKKVLSSTDFLAHPCPQIESNSKFTNEKRMSITFVPNDPAAASFLEVLLFHIIVASFSLC